jgi:hypothetical protein
VLLFPAIVYDIPTSGAVDCDGIAKVTKNGPAPVLLVNELIVTGVIAEILALVDVAVDELTVDTVCPLTTPVPDTIIPATMPVTEPRFTVVPEFPKGRTVEVIELVFGS